MASCCGKHTVHNLCCKSDLDGVPAAAGLLSRLKPGLQLNRKSKTPPVFTTFDRYLLIRYSHVFGITFCALFGLYVVIDAFTNAGDLLNTNAGAWKALRDVAEFYVYRASWFFDAFGGTGTVVAALVTLSLVLRYGELSPILSAGIPTYRLAVPLLVGASVVTVAMVVNQELVIPRIKHHLQMETGDDQSAGTAVEPDYDRATQVHIAGQQIFPAQQRLVAAEFTLPAQLITVRLTTVKAGEAVFCDATPDRPRGWLLRGTSPTLDHLDLIETGRKVILPTAAADEIFVVSDLTPDRLSMRNKNFELLSTRDLVARLKNPTFAAATATQESLHLHSRFVRYLINLLVVMCCMPVLMRKESRSILVNMALCAGLMGTTFGLMQACQFLATSHLLAADLAAWLPVMVIGTVAAWGTGWIRT